MFSNTKKKIFLINELKEKKKENDIVMDKQLLLK